MKQNVSAEKYRLKGKTATTNALPLVIHQYDWLNLNFTDQLLLIKRIIVADNNLAQLALVHILDVLLPYQVFIHTMYPNKTTKQNKPRVTCLTLFLTLYQVHFKKFRILYHNIKSLWRVKSGKNLWKNSICTNTLKSFYNVIWSMNGKCLIFKYLKNHIDNNFLLVESVKLHTKLNSKPSKEKK